MGYWCTPNIMDSPSFINTRQRECQEESNNQRVGAPFQSLGHTSAGSVARCTVLVGCASSLEVPLASGGFTPGFKPLRRGWVYRLAPEPPPFRGMPTSPEIFLKMWVACGLRPCYRTHLKKALRHIRPIGGAYVKYQCINQRDTITCDTICVVDG